MAQTRELWAHCSEADGQEGAVMLGEAIATDSRRREREKGECGLWRLTCETAVVVQPLSLLAHA